MKETKSKSISDLFAESSIVPTTEQSRKNFEDQKGDENLFSGKKEKEKYTEKALEQSVPTLTQKEEQPPLQLQQPPRQNFAAKYGLITGGAIKEIGTGTVEGVGARFFLRKKDGQAQKSIEIWFDPEDIGINDFVDRKLSEGFTFMPLRAIEMETGEILTVSCDRRIPCRIGKRVKVSARLTNGFVNFSLKIIRRENEKNEKNTDSNG